MSLAPLSRAVVLALALTLLTPAVRADEPEIAQPPASPARGGADAVLVTVRSVAIDGLGGSWISENELLNLEVELYWDRTMQPAGYVAPPSGRRGRTLRLWALGGFDRQGTQLYGSGLQAILERVAAFLHERGLRDVRVDLAESALRKLATPGSDGLLLIDVQPARGAP